jgi:cytoskeletal protein RodZ
VLLLVAVLVLLFGVSIACYVAFFGKEEAKADAPDNPPAQTTETVVPETPPDQTETTPAPTESPTPAESSAPAEPSAPSAARRPAPAQTTEAPAARRPASTATVEAEAETPEPVRPKTCEGLYGFSILLCRTEGPARFWQCVPDGIHWNNDIPGCQRDTGTRNRPY